MDVAEYAKAVGIDDEPAFKWWTPYVLRKRDVIIAASATKFKRVTHKYGIEVPRTVEDALRLDKVNGDDFWAKAINKEMTNVGVAFELMDEGAPPPPGWTKVSGHMVFDVKMDFTRKAR